MKFVKLNSSSVVTPSECFNSDMRARVQRTKKDFPFNSSSNFHCRIPLYFSLPFDLSLALLLSRVQCPIEFQFSFRAALCRRGDGLLCYNTMFRWFDVWLSNFRLGEITMRNWKCLVSSNIAGESSKFFASTCCKGSSDVYNFPLRPRDSTV